jgi:hypothetical protein
MDAGQRLAELVELRKGIHHWIRVDGRDNIFLHFRQSGAVNTILAEYDKEVAKSKAFLQGAIKHISARHIIR